MAWATIVQAVHFELKRRWIMAHSNPGHFMMVIQQLNIAHRQATHLMVSASIRVADRVRNFASIPFMACVEWARLDGFANALLEEDEMISSSNLRREAELALLSCVFHLLRLIKP